MISIFQPLPGSSPDYDAWMPVLLEGHDGIEVSYMGAPVEGPRTMHEPENPDQADHEGDLIEHFSRDFYDRIHISDAVLDLGNVIGLQERTVSIWNSFRRNQPLAALTAENDGGITLDGQPAPPIDFAVMQERIYTLTVGTSGPPTIDATYTWDFAPYDIVLRVLGSRITAWSFIPDWSNPILERLEWKTDVLQAYDGTEQTRAIRLSPRKTFEFDAFFIAKERRYAESIIWGWGARTWALPVWHDGLDLPNQATAGDTEILLDTPTRDYSADGLAIILRDAFNFEVVEILDVLADRLQLKRPLSSTWAQGTRIYPARSARLSDQVRMPRWDGDASGTRVSFDLAEPVEYAASAGATLYRDYPVLTHRPEWSGGLDLEMQRKLASLDNITGGRVYEDEAGMASTSQVMRWSWVSRAEQETYRRLLYALRGRNGRLWVPTWARDLLVVTAIGSSATNIDFEFCAYTKQIAQAPNRRDIRIELRSGQVFYRRITGSEEVDDNTERLGINAPLGLLVQVEDVVSVSFMALSRLEGDTVELAHWTGEVCDSVTTFRSSRNDI